MKSVYVCLLVFCASIAVAGCESKQGDTSLANEGVTADQIAQYEAEINAVSGDDAYADVVDDEAGAAGAAASDAAASDAAASDAGASDAGDDTSE